MRTVSALTLAFASAAALILSAPSFAIDPPPGRVELKRADLSGAPGMEVISSITEFKPGETVAMHMHNGIEAGYVVQGAMIEAPGQAPSRIETGSPVFNLRGVVHGGYKVVGDTSLKIFAVHVVDKGKPLYDLPAK
jgi:quercetin dioxygenase-like cupin family protein